MNTKIKQWLPMLFACLITMAAFSGSAAASEFSADFVMKGGPMSGKGKIWVKGNKMRQEFGDQFGKVITIIDLDQGIQWVLMPENKMYMENKIETTGKGFRPENFAGMQQGQMKAKVKLVGSEKVNGYACDKYVITFENKEMGTMTHWFAKKLDYPIKTINESAQMGKVVTELENIRKEDVKDDLFKVPEGYKEMKQPMMPQMPTDE